MNLPANQQITPGQRLNTVHVCLIPAGMHRGEVLVWDGNLTQYGTRAYQPWSIVNPYWPASNPNFWPGQTTPQYRFHNATIAMPMGRGELFCAGQDWMADGRLLVAGGTRRYPLQTGGGWEGERFVYQWDPVATAGNPFGTWWQMADLEADRWYPTVRADTTQAHGAIVIGGTHWTQASGTREVNSYEVPRIAFNALPNPQLLPPPNDFDRKPAPGTQPNWPTLPIPAASRRQYWGPEIPVVGSAAFGDYPRLHSLGILDPVANGFAPRLFVSGFLSWGLRWAHHAPVDPQFGSTILGQGYEIGQFPANSDESVAYGTSLLLPTPIGGISTKVARIGGRRDQASIPPESNLVETVSVNVMPSSWQAGAGGMPSMLHRRHFGNVVILPNGQLFAVGGQSAPGSCNLVPELLSSTTAWAPMAPHVGARDYHSAAILLPDARVFVCGGENRAAGSSPGADYLIWEPPYFHLDYGSLPPTGIQVRHATTLVAVPQHVIGAANNFSYGQEYEASWSNTLEEGITVDGVVLVRPAALTHHDDGGQRLVRLMTWTDSDGGGSTVHFKSPSSSLQAPPGWWMVFLVTSSGRPSQAYWVHLL